MSKTRVNAQTATQASPRTLHLAPLTSNAFAPFGTVIQAPALHGDRNDYSRSMGSQRTGMEARFHVNNVPPASLPYPVKLLERHPYAAQLFLPLDVESYVIVVAPTGGDGNPEIASARCFIADSTVGILYAPGTWHAGITVLARTGSFGVLMWRNDTEDDEEFFPLASPLLIEA